MGFEREPSSCAAPKEASSAEVQNCTTNSFQSCVVVSVLELRNAPSSSAIPDLSDRENGRIGTTCEGQC